MKNIKQTIIFILLLFIILVSLKIFKNNIENFNLNNSNNFVAITLFKNYTPTFFTFQNFYSKLWGVNEFIYLVGYISDNDLNYIKNNYVKQCGNIENIQDLTQINKPFINNVKVITTKNKFITCKFILYKTVNSDNSINNFNNIKETLFKYFFDNLYVENKRYISVDDDEFLYSTNIKHIKTLDKYRFHFIEIIPKNDIDTLEFSFQSWYLNKIEKQSKGYCCNACKTFYFNSPNKELTKYGLWEHSNTKYFDKSPCDFFMNKIVNQNSFHKNYNNLKEKGICFHVTALTFKNLIQTKLKNRFSSNKNKDSTGNYKNLQKDFYKVKENYKTIIDNTLLEYLDKRDMENLKE